MKQIDGDRVLREIRKQKNMVVISCKKKYFPLDLIWKIIREAPEVGICESKVTSNADRIRSMSDEELASQLVIKVDDGEGVSLFLSLPTERIFITKSIAEKVTLEWLKETYVRVME